MTLIITAIAAALAAAAYVLARRRFPGLSSSLVVLALIYTGAALMWCVDGFASLIEGGSFIELADTAQMADDALLGAVVVGVGLVVWGAYVLITSHRRTMR